MFDDMIWPIVSMKSFVMESVLMQRSLAMANVTIVHFIQYIVKQNIYVKLSMTYVEANAWIKLNLQYTLDDV